MRMKHIAVAVLGSLLATTPVGAQVIDFTSSGCTSGCTSFSESGVTFSSAVGGSNLQVGNFGVQSNGNGLAVYDDTNSNYLIGDLSFIASGITLDFGNDDAFYTNPGDLALLNVFLANILVGTAQVALNRDDIMNQTIGFSGTGFDRFTFAYTDATGVPLTGGGNAFSGLTEIVDNITLVQGAVPEPSTWAMMLFGFAAMGVSIRRRRRTHNLLQAT